MVDSPVRYRIRYVGHVQGVGFRMTTVAQARGLAVHGFVRNEPDGSVLVDVEGTLRDVKELMRRVAEVLSDNIDETMVQEMPPRGSGGGFQIRY